MYKRAFKCDQIELIPAEESQGPQQSTEGKGNLLQTWRGKYNYQIGHFYLKKRDVAGID